MLFLYEEPLAAAGGEDKKRIEFHENIRPGYCTYLYFGHVRLDVDNVGVEPTSGFLVTSSLFKPLKDTDMDNKPGSITIVDHVEMEGKLGFIRGQEGEFIEVKNLDANAYRVLIKILTEKKKELDGRS